MRISVGKRFLLLVLFSCVVFLDATCQEVKLDSLPKKTEWYNASHPNDLLYLATDKTLYIPTETIWFAGYLFGTSSREDTLRPEILSVALMKSDTGTVSIRKNYVMNDNLCAGSLTLPDTLPPGDYLLMACTDMIGKSGKPLHTFRTPITVKSILAPPITVDVDLAGQRSADTLLIRAKVRVPDASLPDLHKARIRYHLLHQRARTVKVDQLGRASVSLPIEELRGSNHVLYTSTSIGKDSKQFNIRLPIAQSDTVCIRFYPEGGNLVAGLKSRVAWQASSAAGVPAKITAELLEDGRIVDTIQTGDGGIGTFGIYPKNQHAYAVRTIERGHAARSLPCPLPEPLASGALLEVPNAVVADTLAFRVACPDTRKVRAAITSVYSRESVLTPLLTVNGERRIRIALKEVQKGLNILTLLDEQAHPLAERLFFAHTEKRTSVAIKTDKSSYRPRDEVSVVLNITDEAGKSIGGLFTVSCVLLSRLDTINKKNIADYYYMASLGKDQNKDDLEKTLLVKGWQRNLWQQIWQAKEGDGAPRRNQIKIRGKVQYADGSKIRRPMNLLIVQGGLLKFQATDERGYFSPHPAEMAIPEDGKMEIKVLDKTKAVKNASLSVDDPMERLMQDVVVLPQEVPPTLLTQQSSGQQQLKTGVDMPNVLQTVVVTAKRKPVEYGFGPNKCGDYVCRNNVLNCLNHTHEPDNRPAVNGETYKLPSGGDILYRSCRYEDDKLAIFTSRKFYGMDSTLLQNKNDKQYLPTLFWKPFTAIAKDQQASIRFHTSDLQGAYKITIEGIADNGDFLYEEKDITVHNP